MDLCEAASAPDPAQPGRPFGRYSPLSLRSLVPLIREIERHDSDLARQLKRAMSSVPLHIAEGSYSRGFCGIERPPVAAGHLRSRGKNKNRFVRYHTALGSTREALACLETAAAFGYIAQVGSTITSSFDHVLGTLVRLIRH